MTTHIVYTVSRGKDRKFTSAEIINFLQDIPDDAEITINYNSGGSFLIAEFDHQPMHVLVPGGGEEDS